MHTHRVAKDGRQTPTPETRSSPLLQIRSWIGDAAFDGGRRRSRRARQDGADALPLPSHEIAVRGRDDKLARRALVAIHGDAHGAAGKPPFGPRAEKDLVEAFGFRRTADILRARNDQRHDALLDLAAFED